MARPQPLPKMTFDEFLEWESRQEQRHEFVDGLVYAMTGGSKNHNLIAGNIYMSLRMRHDDRGCKVYQENVLLRVGLADGIGYYPDVMLVCDPDDLKSERHVENPCLVVEVLSDSTQGLDRFKKFRDYQRIESLTTYVLVSQQAVHVEVFHRANGWRTEVLTRLDEAVPIDCGPGDPTAITLAEIYRGLDFGV